MKAECEKGFSKDMRRLCIFLLAVLCSGCVNISATRYSHGYVMEENKVVKLDPFEEQGYELEDFYINIRSLNDRRNTLTVFPFSGYYGESKGSSKEYALVFKIEPKQGNILVDPGRIVLQTANGEIATPIKIAEPRECDSEYINGNLDSISPPFISLNVNQTVCFWVVYDFAGPDPSNEFLLDVGGVSSGGKEIKIPRFVFRKNLKHETFIGRKP